MLSMGICKALSPLHLALLGGQVPLSAQFFKASNNWVVIRLFFVSLRE